MRRLSIIDLAGGHQPVHNEDETVQCVFNGEIYNYRELRAELEGQGHRFYTHSDTEVIVHGYEQWGEGVFARLDGMFGIALWDTRKRALLLARDRFGEKPLFYSEAGEQLVFASELKSLLHVPGLRREIDPAAVRAYVTFGYVPTPGSIYRGVHKLPPGCFLRFEDGRARVTRYYTLELGPKLTLDEREAEEQLAQLLDAAVKSRLVSDVPFGAFLSGGLDSSVVVALMARHLSQPVRTFSIGFREPKYNELSDARRVADHVKTEHHELVVEPDAVELLQSLVWYLDEPFADSSAVPTYLVAKLAREHVKMVLTGDGGDESFGGYDRYLRFLDLERVRSFNPVVSGAAQLAGRFVPGANGYRLRRIAERLRQTFPDSYLSGVAVTRADVSDALLGEAVRAPGADHYGSLADVARAAHDLEALDRCVSIDFASYLPDDVLVKLDRMAMANSLEGRSPLLAHRRRRLRRQAPARAARARPPRQASLASRRRPPTCRPTCSRSRRRASASRWARGSAGRSKGSPPTSSAAAPFASAACCARRPPNATFAATWPARPTTARSCGSPCRSSCGRRAIWTASPRRWGRDVTLLSALLYFQLLFVVNQLHFPWNTGIPGLVPENIIFLVVLLQLRGKPEVITLREPPILQKALLCFFGALFVAFLWAEVTAFNDPVADLTYLKNACFYPLYYFMYLRCKQDEKTTRWLIIWIMVIAAVAGLEAIREGFDYGIGKYNPFRRASGPFGTDWHQANRAGVFFGMFTPMFLALALFLKNQKLWRLAAIGGVVLVVRRRALHLFAAGVHPHHPGRGGSPLAQEPDPLDRHRGHALRHASAFCPTASRSASPRPSSRAPTARKRSTSARRAAGRSGKARWACCASTRSASGSTAFATTSATTRSTSTWTRTTSTC